MKGGFNAKADPGGDSRPPMRKALFEAIAMGDRDKIRGLLDAGADVHSTNAHGTSALFYACASRTDVFAMMLEQVPDPAAVRGRRGITLMHEAATSGNAQSIRLLARAGVDVNQQGSHMYTPLMLAALDGHGAAVEALLDAGADPTITTAGRFTALHAAAIGGDVRSVELLTRTPAVAFINAPDRDNDTGQTPLELAVAFLHPAAVTELVRHGALVNHRGTRGSTPLHHVLRLTGKGRPNLDVEKEERLEIVGFLLSQGADIMKNPTGMLGDTALHLAAADVDKGAVIVAMMLDMLPCGIDTPNKAGETALHRAALNGSPETVALLIGAGADVDARSKTGVTPLMLAASANMRRSVEALLKAGADTEFVSAGGQRAENFTSYDRIGNLIAEARPRPS